MPPVSKAFSCGLSRDRLASQLDFFRAKSTGRKLNLVTFSFNALSSANCSMISPCFCKSVIELLVEQISSTWAEELMVSSLMERPNSLVWRWCRRESITTRNNIGERTDPCRTPRWTRKEWERVPACFTTLFGLVYQRLQHFPLIPRLNRCERRVGNSMESKAFSRS